MKNIFSKKLINKIFDIAVLLKSLFGFFEVLVGLALLISGKVVINNLILVLTQQEIIDDPHDFFANILIKTASNFSAGSHIFAVVYLIFHGVINISLAVALLRNKIWAYPWAMAGFGLFIVYQTYKYFQTYSLLLLLLTIFDLFIVFLIWLEYKRQIKKINRQES